MNIATWYFTFHAPHLKSPFGILGHVEMCGVTTDNTWFFLDPQRTGTRFHITHHHDDIEERLALMMSWGDTLRLEKTFKLTLPIWIPMNCASICGQMVGIRAFAPATLRRKLLRNGAEVINGRTKGKRGVETGA